MAVGYFLITRFGHYVPDAVWRLVGVEVDHPSNWNKVTFNRFLLEKGQDQIANQIVEQSRSAYPTATEEDSAKMRVQLASCIESGVRDWLKSDDPVLTQETTADSKEYVLRPILMKCAEYHPERIK